MWYLILLSYICIKFILFCFSYINAEEPIKFRWSEYFFEIQEI